MHRSQIISFCLASFILGFVLCLAFLGFRVSFSGFAVPYLVYEEQDSSPHDFIQEDQVFAYPDRVVIYVANATVSSYTDSGSMIPTVNSVSQGIRITPASPELIHVGDLVSYYDGDVLIMHRVIEVSSQNGEYYYTVAGDSPGAKRQIINFYQVKYITIGIIY